MIRSQITLPHSGPNEPDNLGRRAYISLDADYCDQRAALEVEAPPSLHAAVLERLTSATGVRGQPLERFTTPEDLACALQTVVLRDLQPVLVEGQEVLDRRQSPKEALEFEGMAVMIAYLVVHDLPELDQFGSYRRDHVVTTLPDFLDDWRPWMAVQRDRTAALERFAAALAVNIDLRIQQDRERLPAQPLVPENLDPVSAVSLARTVVEVLEAADECEIASLATLVELRDRVAALGFTFVSERA